jgi:hypothetical protein
LTGNWETPAIARGGRADRRLGGDGPVHGSLLEVGELLIGERELSQVLPAPEMRPSIMGAPSLARYGLRVAGLLVHHGL